MEFEEKEEQKLDLFVILDDFLREARRLMVLGLVLTVLLAAGLTVFRYIQYSPVYEASVTFTVKVANPLFSSVNSYNTQTAEQMARTFPYVATSAVLQERVKAELGIAYMPSVTVTASAGSSLLTMRVRDGDPQKAYDVLNAVMTHYPEVAEFVVGSTVMVLLDESGVPTAPVNSFSPRGHLLKGAVFGIGIWMALALLLAMTKRTIHSEDELKRVLNFAVLGQIPSVKVVGKVSCPMISKPRINPAFVESIQLLRLRVEKTMQEEQKKILLVSSAVPGEGKTTISVNLAMAMARKGKRVLLIDCDLRNPSVTKAMQMSSRNSLAEYLAGKVTIKDMLQPTDMENFYIIAGGNGGKTNFSELLSQGRVARLIQAARNLFDYVILDTPPCSLLADAAEVAELAECGIMVVRQDQASRDQILDGAQRLGDGSLPLIGCVLNGTRKTLASGGEAQGYGYGYGYGYGKK